MITFRIALKKYIHDLSGTGSFLYGGRWSLKGIQALYTANSRSLAYLEFLVHQLDKTSRPSGVFISAIEIKNPEKIIRIEQSQLPIDWQNIEFRREVQETASKYFTLETLGIEVPSVIVLEESNIILNPQFKGFNNLVNIKSIDPLNIDKRFNL